jgi:Zn-dependent protease
MVYSPARPHQADHHLILQQALQDPLYFVTLLSTLIVGLTVHEFAHAWSAWRLGDDTAAVQGRLSLNPVRHLDVMGSIAFLLAGFGWARPVPINPYRLGHRGVLWVALAGPVSNLLLATIALVPLRFVDFPGPAAGMALFFGSLNIGLAVFNMIPVAPLDGWKVMMGLVSADTAWKLAQYESYGPIVLLFLIFAPSLGMPNIVGSVIGSAQAALVGLLAGIGLG